MAEYKDSDEEREDSEDLWLRAEEEAKDAATTTFLDAPTHRRRRQGLGRSSLESSASRLFGSQEADFFDSSSKGSSNDSDSRNGEGEEEEEEDDNDDEEEEMENLAPDYP
ncbi:hypothetical protein ACB092_08G067300 [Castanea dentata]